MRRSRQVGLALVVSLLALTPSRTARAEEKDPWWGPDKALHFSISAGLAAGGYGVSAIWLEPRWQRATVGAGGAITLGAGKELYDATGHGNPSFKDFTWDVAGAAVGTAIALLVDVLVSRGTEPPNRTEGEARSERSE